jgi:nucleoside-specific outer membrane channel protein Tsx
MNVKSSIFGAVLALASVNSAIAADVIGKASSPPPSAPLPFFIFADTQLSYWHEFSGAEPAVGKPIQKDIVTITHFDVWKYGTNFVNIDFLKSDDHDPAAPWGGPGFPIPAGGIGDGAFEVYGLFRSTLSFNALSGSKAFSIGPVKDVSLYYGADANTKNTAFAPQKRDALVGLQVSFAVPGYLNVSANYYKEWNHNGIVPLIGFPPGMTENVEFEGVPEFEAQYMQPLGFFGLPLKFSGFTNVVLPKGKDGFGTQTKRELLTDNRLTLDLGKLTSNKPNWVDLFVGYRYWQNKFGSNHTLDATGGSTESTAYVGLAWHVF